MYSVTAMARPVPVSGMGVSENLAAKNSAEITLLQQQTLLLIDSRALSRECLARGLSTAESRLSVQAFGSVEEWKRQSKNPGSVSALLYVLGSRKVTDPAVGEEVEKLCREFKNVPVVLLAESDDIKQIARALELGVKGYIPSSISIRVCIEAISLTVAGGVFVPASSVLSMRKLLQTGSEAPSPMNDMFTERQAAVVEALRRGKANKIIAYELKLRESTVKVHIRNIMKKLKATNRTEVAYKINDLFPIHH